MNSIGWRFSPHTRGCSESTWFRNRTGSVFPAYAGMFPIATPGEWRVWGFPRIRGDVPMCRLPPVHATKFSPHTRGCSQLFERSEVSPVVFPAYAGMFRTAATHMQYRGLFSPHTRGCSARQQPTCSTVACFPRIRGDVPVRPQILNNPEAFSPHTRGCSAPTMPPIMAAIVFPAYAGMFRSGGDEAGHNSSFPRIRGDVPSYPYWAYLTCLFSPHTRGCSSYQPDSVRKGKGFPRIRGDVPRRAQAEYVKALFSPHTRGCSVMAAFRGGDDGVFPAYAGMFH